MAAAGTTATATALLLLVVVLVMLVLSTELFCRLLVLWQVEPAVEWVKMLISLPEAADE